MNTKLLFITLLIFFLTSSLPLVSAFHKIIKRHGLDGGIRDFNVSESTNDEAIREIDTFIRTEYLHSCQNIFPSQQLGKLIRVQVQIVAGTNYLLTYTEKSESKQDQHLTVKVFRTLPDSSGHTQLSITSCF